MGTRILEVDWHEEHTSIFELYEDGTVAQVMTSTPGPEIQRVREPGNLAGSISRPLVLDYNFLLDAIIEENW